MENNDFVVNNKTIKLLKGTSNTGKLMLNKGLMNVVINNTINFAKYGNIEATFIITSNLDEAELSTLSKAVIDSNTASKIFVASFALNNPIGIGYYDNFRMSKTDGESFALSLINLHGLGEIVFQNS